MAMRVVSTIREAGPAVALCLVAASLTDWLPGRGRRRRQRLGERRPAESPATPRDRAARTVVRRFWCATARREVEVAFAAVGAPGVRRLTAVRHCPAELACRRTCLDAGFRRQWEPALPVQSRGGAVN